MAALISCILSLVKVTKTPSFHHPLNLTFPPVMHQVLENQFLQNFKEIFIIGDVHGCFDELEALLELADVVDNTSLKIFVGDLVNKGPKNHQVLEKLRNSPSMLAVRGNHDEIVLREYFNSQNSEYQLKEKNLWIKDLPKEDIDYLNNLPYTISIPSLQAVVVHAGLVPGIPLSCNDPETMVTMRNLVLGDYFWEGGLRAIKTRSEGDAWASMWPGPNHVYFGHDAKRMLQIYPYATGLDTGCVYGNWLTGLFISGPRKGTFVKMDAVRIYSQPKSKSSQSV